MSYKDLILLNGEQYFTDQGIKQYQREIRSPEALLASIDDTFVLFPTPTPFLLFFNLHSARRFGCNKLNKIITYVYIKKL